MNRFTLCFLWLLWQTSFAQTVPTLPLKISDNGRYFVGQNGQPFLYQADTGWQIFSRLTLNEAREYLVTRKAHGYTAIQVMFSFNPDSANRAGQKPLIDYDFAKPNDAYFAHAERVLTIADSLGLVINIAPFWIGCCREGFGEGAKHEVYKQSGPDKARQMGQYLGKRFGKYKNILWTMGGDNDPKSIRAGIVAMAEGLHQAAPRQLITFHASPPHSSTDLFQYAPWLGYSMIYTYWREKPNEWVDGQQLVHVYETALREYNKSDRMPFILGEAQYEGDGVRYSNDMGTPQQMRRQAWWTMLCGGAGHAYGHDGWNFPTGWRQIINYPAGSQQLRHVRGLLETFPWWQLQPDQKHTVLVSGYGDYMRDSYVAAAVSEDKTRLVAYLPKPGLVTVNLGQLKGAALVARWFDPRTGQFGKPEVLAGQSGLKRFISPPQDDWVLVIQP